MAFDIVGPTRSVSIGDGDERILHELPARFGLRTPECDRLWTAFYASPRVVAARVPALREEIAAIRAAHEQESGKAVARERNVHARDPHVRAAVIAGLLANDPILAKCDELVALCDDAISRGDGLTCISD